MAEEPWIGNSLFRSSGSPTRPAGYRPSPLRSMRVNPSTIPLRHHQESVLEQAVHALESPRRLRLQTEMRRVLQGHPIFLVLARRRHSVSIRSHGLLDLLAEGAHEGRVKQDTAEVGDRRPLRVVPSPEEDDLRRGEDQGRLRESVLRAEHGLADSSGVHLDRGVRPTSKDIVVLLDGRDVVVGILFLKRIVGGAAQPVQRSVTEHVQHLGHDRRIGVLVQVRQEPAQMITSEYG